MRPDDIPAAPSEGNTTIFLEGPAGAGKTTLARARLLHLLRSGVPARSILVLVPQRSLGLVYQGTGGGDAAGGPSTPLELASPPRPRVDVLTLGGLARRSVDLFWPLISGVAGFARPHEAPTFLTLETAQYYMSRQSESFRHYGHFDGVKIAPPRLASQVLDNLNKAAVVGFPITEIADRLKAAWSGDSRQLAIYDSAQAVGVAFRDYCLQHNLLDFSLQVEVFARHLLHSSEYRQYLHGRYHHVLADNVEEDTPVAHDLLREWLGVCDSGLVVFDRDAGFRVFLGADPEDAYTLKGACRHHALLVDSRVSSPAVERFGVALAGALGGNRAGCRDAAGRGGPVEARWLAERGGPGWSRASDAGAASGGTQEESKSPRADAALPSVTLEERRFFPQMVQWAAGEIARLVTTDHVPASEIVVLAPYLTDALRFSLTSELAAFGITTRSHRPSRSLAEEPAARCLLTLAALAHPQWGICPSKFDVAYAFATAIDGLDLVRAHVLTECVYRQRQGKPGLTSFAAIIPATQERITYLLGNSYDTLCAWLAADQSSGSSLRSPDLPLDHFLTLMFDEVLSRPGFAFHRDLEAAAVAARLIESVRKFRQAVPQERGPAERSVAQEYIAMVEQGVLAATSLAGERPGEGPDTVAPGEGTLPQRADDGTPPVSSGLRSGAVLLAPAYTFLLRNQAVDYQFWLNIGSTGWWERIYQPLTQPYVLSRRTGYHDLDSATGHDAKPVTTGGVPAALQAQGAPAAGAKWTDADEFAARQASLRRLVLGLTRRCRKGIYLGIVTLSESGMEERGPLLRALQRVVRQSR